MDDLNSTIMKFFACDTVILGVTLYVTHRWIPGPAYIASLIPFPGFEKSVTVGEAIVAGLFANVLAHKIAEKTCMQ